MTHLAILEGIFFFVAGVTICCAFVPDSQALIMAGDLLLGGLFPIHSTLQGKKCINIQGQDGIQALEAMKYSIKSVNEDSELLPGIELGMVGVDTCESETVALDNTLELIDMRINKNVGSETCSCKSKVIMTNKLVGIVGPSSSKLSIPVANLLRLFKIPQISYQSTSPELSDKTRFEYFKRTVPSDHFQVRVIADILKYMDYRYISVVYEDSSYGLNYKTGLERLSESGDICIGTSLKLPYDQSDEQNKRIIETLLQHKNTNGHVVVVLILRPGSATSLFKSVSEMNEVKSFNWIGADGWTGRSFSKEIKHVLNGAIGVQLLFGNIPGFKDYFVSMYDISNPWWEEYRETYKDRCTSDICDLDELGILHYINDAVRAFAHALNDMHTTKCGNSNGICPELEKSLKREPALLETLGKVEFTDSQGEQFKFYNNSEGPPRYSIMRYHSTGKIEWEIIGNYSDMGNKEKIYFQKYQKNVNYEGSSICSLPCEAGEAKTIVTDRCCWQCTLCGTNQYSTSMGCLACPHGYRTNTEKTNCTKINIEYMDFGEPAAIGTLTVSLMGIVVCIFVIVIFINKRETPLVKATDLKLSLILIFGIILSYGSSAAFLAKPSIITCGLTRCLLGICYTLQYATILTKTIRIYRLFEAKSPEKKKLINSRASITLTLLLTFFHVIALTAWIIFDRPKTSVKYDSQTGVLICADVENVSYLFSLSYSVALLIACVIFAIKTRKIPDGFKETRFIAICSYTTCIIWLAFASTFFFTNNNTVRVLSLCITLSINSSVSVSVIFLSRIYIILCKPNLNTRDRVMTRGGNEKSDRTSYLTANKSVGTDDETTCTQDGFLAATSVSVPNLAPFLHRKEVLSSPHSVDDIHLLNNMKEDKNGSRNNDYVPLQNLPRITIQDTDHGNEFNA